MDKIITLSEVFNEIKPGEVWVNIQNENLKVTLTDTGNVLIKFPGVWTISELEMDLGSWFKLEYKKYTFAEAYEALKKGKQIENIESGNKYKFENKTVYYYSVTGNWVENTVFNIDEIDGGWYIYE